jgi:hypothetical protein
MQYTQSFNQVVSYGAIVWNENERLHWDNFMSQGNKEEGDNLLAYSSCNFKAVAFFLTDSTSCINTETEFYSKLSWAKDTLDSITLRHEQLHFDIFEIYARMMRKELLETKFTRQSIFEITKKMRLKYELLCKDKNTKYDLDSNYSFDADKQKEWEDIISKKLAELNAFKNTQLIVMSK